MDSGSAISVQSFIELPSMIPEILRGALKTPPGPLNSKKAWTE